MAEQDFFLFCLLTRNDIRNIWPFIGAELDSGESKRVGKVVSGAPGESNKLKTSLGNPLNVVPMTLDAVQQADEVLNQIAKSDAVVSLLPATMHVPIVTHAIATGIPKKNSNPTLTIHRRNLLPASPL